MLDHDITGHDVIKKAFCHLLIPFAFEQSDWEKIENCNGEPSKEFVDKIKEQKKNNEKIDIGTLEWFSYCFKKQLVNETLQMMESPLLNSSSGTWVKQIVGTQWVREWLGLHYKENRPCYLGKDRTEFRIGKIRLLFFKMGIGIIHLETESENLLPGELLNLSEGLGAIHKKGAKFLYDTKTDRDHTVTMSTLTKDLIRKILTVQNYIQLDPYKKETFLNAYLLEYFFGNINQGERLKYFEMLRNRRRNNMRSDDTVPAANVYKSFEYLSWIIGDRTLFCFGDLSNCGDDNKDFLTGSNGLVTSIDLNYVTIYAYFIALKLLFRDAERSGIQDQELSKLFSNLPKERLSAEPHINKLFDEYVVPAWRIGDNTEKVGEDSQGGLHDKISALSLQMNQMGETLSEGIHGLTEKTDYLVNQVDLLVSFADNELKTFLEKERKKLREADDAHPEEKVEEFISHTASYIDERIRISGDEIVRIEKKGLQTLFGERWDKLLPTSQTSLVSAGALLKRCADISTPDFDFSGICICATAALEAELRRAFFDGLLDYMVKKYGDPETLDANEVFKYWPDELLIVSKDQSGEDKKQRIRKARIFTMGKLPFLFGETAKLSNELEKRNKQLKQAEMMKSRMSEYLETVVYDWFKSMSYESFYLKSDSKDSIRCQPGCFVGKCEEIRENYRNKAAHTSVMSGEEAALCYERIVTKPDSYVYNAKVAGVILELFSKIDGSKLRDNSLAEKSSGLKNASVDVKGDNSTGHLIGNVVELENLEVSSKGTLRGTIVGSTKRASLSKKYLQEKGISPKKYLGKKISVRLCRWDENGQIFNAELI